MKNEPKQYLTGFVDSSGRYPLGDSFKASWGRLLFANHNGSITVIEGNRMPWKHLVVETKSEKKAREISVIVYACFIVLQSFDLIGWDLSDIYQFELQEFKNVSTYDIIKLSNNYIYYAGIMAAKASFRDTYMYAIHKLAYSMMTYSIPFIELDPMHGNIPKPNLGKPFTQSIRILMASAVIFAYSAIEELGLDVQATRDNPTKDRNDIWIQEKREEIKTRLEKAKINTAEKFVWDRRGRSTLLERKRIFQIDSEKCSWSFGSCVRDEEIDLIDALDRASFLRSQVASHKFSTKNGKRNKLIKLLSPHDVSNVQHLARRLILERLGLLKCQDYM